MDPSGSQRIREDLWGTKCRKLSETGASRSFGSWRIAADIPMPWRRDPVDPRSTRSTWLPSTCAMYCHSVLWFLLISMISVDFCWFLLISVDFYWFLLISMIFTSYCGCSKAFKTINHHPLKFNRMINSGCVRFSPHLSWQFWWIPAHAATPSTFTETSTDHMFLVMFMMFMFIFDKHNQTWYTIEIYI